MDLVYVTALLEKQYEVRIIKQVDFLDGNLTLDKKRMETICDLIVKRKLDIECVLKRC